MTDLISGGASASVMSAPHEFWYLNHAVTEGTTALGTATLNITYRVSPGVISMGCAASQPLACPVRVTSQNPPLSITVAVTLPPDTNGAVIYIWYISNTATFDP